MVLTLRDISEIRESWQDHPIAEILADDSLLAFFEPIIKSTSADGEPGFTDVMKNDFGLTWEDLFELLPGQFSLAIYNMPELILKQDDNPDIAILAEFSSSEERLNELMQVQFERNAKAQEKFNPLIEHEMIEETFMGETLYFDETFDGEKTYVEDGYALVDGVFILATPEDRMRTIVEAIKVGSDDSLASNSAYQRAREESGRGDFSIYLNFESLMPPLNQALQQKAVQSLAMFGVSAQGFNTALALEELQALSFEFDLVDNGLMFYNSVVYREKAGLMKLMAYADGELPKAPYVPEKIFSSAVTRFDPGAMLDSLEFILSTASPGAMPLLDIHLQNFKNQSGLDMRAAILDNFDPEMVTLSLLPGDSQSASSMIEPEQLFVFSIKDSQALSDAVEILKDMMPGARAQIRTLEYEGETIHTIPGAEDPSVPDAPVMDVSFVVTRGHFIFSIGRVGLVQQVLTAMQTQDSGFWQLPEIEALFERIERPDAVARSYYDFGAIILPLLSSMVDASRYAQTGLAFDPNKIPSDLQLDWHFITETSEAPDGFYTRSIMLRKEVSQ